MRKLILAVGLMVATSANAYDWEASSRAYDRSQQQYYQVQQQRQQEQMLYEMRRQREAMERQRRQPKINYLYNQYNPNSSCFGC